MKLCPIMIKLIILINYTYSYSIDIMINECVNEYVRLLSANRIYTFTQLPWIVDIEKKITSLQTLYFML